MLIVDQVVGQRVRIVQIQHRAQGRFGQLVGRVGGDGHNEIINHVARGLARGGAPDFNLQQIAVLEAFDQHPVHAFVQLGNHVVNRQLGGLLEFAHQRQPVLRRHHDLEGAGLAVAKGVFAGVVNVKTVMRVLDDRHAQAAHLEGGNQLFDQRCLARAGVTGKSDHVHEATFSKPALL